MEVLIVRDRRIDYDGSAIQSHWAYRNFGILGNSLVVFRGKCNVKVEEMIDIEDLRQKKEIRSEVSYLFLAELLFSCSVLRRMFYHLRRG